MARRAAAASRYMLVPLYIAILVALYMISQHSYLLFHGIVETFGVMVAVGVFVIAFQTRFYHNYGGLVFLGIAYIFLALLNVIHTLAYAGMGVFTGYDANLPTQVWVAARYLQSISMLLAFLHLRSRLRPHLQVGVYAGVVALVLLSLFRWGLFPDAFLPDAGLTPFKVASGYVISLIFAASGVVLVRKRRELDTGVYRLLLASIIMAIASELAFTLYIGVYDLFNMAGHFMNLVAFYLMYKAIIETGFTRPYALLFRDLRENEQALRQSESLLRSVVSNAPVALFSTDSDGTITLFEGTGLAALGLEPGRAVGQSSLEALDGWPALADKIKCALRGEACGEQVEGQDGSTLETRLSPIRGAEGRVTGVIGVVTDVTERRRAEAMTLRMALAARVREVEESERRRLARELHDHVGGNLSALGISLNIIKGQLAKGQTEDVPPRIDDSLSLLAETTRAVRSVMSDLRPPGLDELGLMTALRGYGAQFSQRVGVEVHVDGDESEPRLGAQVELALFRITQEALSNVAKHAQATQVAIRMECRDGVARLEVVDDGVGFERETAPGAERRSWGLLNMAERAEAIGGSCWVESRPGRGTRVLVEVPHRQSALEGSSLATAQRSSEGETP